MAVVMNRQRYEKEIEDILAKAGEKTPEQPDHTSEDTQVPRRRSSSQGRGRTARGFRLKFQYPLMVGIGLIVFGAILHWLYFFAAGLVLVAAGYLIYYRSPRGGPKVDRTSQVWRGRSVEPDDPSDRERRR